MSFSTSQKYGRPILEPIHVAAGPHASTKNNYYIPKSSSSESSLWKSTIHSFIGTENRVSVSSWPPAKFDEDPAGIPDDAENNIHYSPKSAENAEGGGVYRMYAEQKPASASDSAFVPPPRLLAKRYLPKQNVAKDSTSKPALTLLMLPGMSLAKEVFEPMIEIILAKQQALGFSVAEIWSFDMPMSGETALANPQGYLYGNEKDISRDLMLFVTAYLPVVAGQDLPSELVARPLNDGNRQSVRSDLHVVAHSLGAQCAMLIAAHAPNLFASLTLFDPAMIPNGPIRKAFVALPKDALCKGINFEHESRSSLLSELKTNKRTRSWDPRIMEIFADHATVQTAQGGLQLTAHPRLEWALYYDQETPTQCYDRLADLRLPLNAIMPARPFAVPVKMLEADMAKLPQKTKLTWIPKTTHQLPFERVDECAELVAVWFGEMMQHNKARL